MKSIFSEKKSTKLFPKRKKDDGFGTRDIATAGVGAILGVALIKTTADVVNQL